MREGERGHELNEMVGWAECLTWQGGRKVGGQGAEVTERLRVGLGLRRRKRERRDHTKRAKKSRMIGHKQKFMKREDIERTRV